MIGYRIISLVLLILCLVLPGCKAPTSISSTQTLTDFGTIIINATLDGSPWSGGVFFSLVGLETISGSSLPQSITHRTVGIYTLNYDSGGPPKANFVGVATSPTKTLSVGGTITFTLQFTSSGGIISVNATLDGSPWSGIASYTLTGPQTFSSSSVPQIFANKSIGTYTITYNSGGPPNATLISITPSSTQIFAADSSITFTLNFSTAKGTITPLPTTTNTTMQHIETIMIGIGAWGGANSGKFYTDVSYTKVLNAGDEVSGFVELTGQYYSPDWSDVWNFQVYGPSPKRVIDQTYVFDSDMAKNRYNFSFTASSYGTYKIVVTHHSYSSRNLVIEVQPKGWRNCIEVERMRNRFIINRTLKRTVIDLAACLLVPGEINLG